MDDWLDEAVRRGAPRPLGAEPVAAGEAVAVAHAVATAGRHGRRMSRRGAFLGGAALSLGILGLGVTAAAAAPTVIDWLGWAPDVVAQRTFDVGAVADLGLCEVFVRVLPEPSADLSAAEVERRTEAARMFLTEHDWQPMIDSITEREIQTQYELEVAQRAAFTGPDGIVSGATPPPATMSTAATLVIADRISDEFERAGHLRGGVSLEQAAGPCVSEGAN
ncbi:hypothetical protein ACFCVO_07200 [Agromyces sp. NPDC056379]|uniref:hypothetical protein n=1 Tax=unclassified Agromyces TaxID=2639701 RepID=UPI0035E16E51